MLFEGIWQQGDQCGNAEHLQIVVNSHRLMLQVRIDQCFNKLNILEIIKLNSMNEFDLEAVYIFSIGQLIFDRSKMKLRIPCSKYFNSIDEFCMIKDIGIGSFGSVKLALHIETNKCYAVKIVELDQKISQSELLILERQINIHSSIDHPHIIKLWDVLLDEDRVYMIMELAENGTLFSYQNKHPTITEAEVFKFFNQTLNAIKYLHSQDIMHRDLKPENILLDNCFNVKLCDLGWATDNIEQKRKTFCGTYEYMAPEMVFENQYNYKIDIWALGVLLYQLLHGYAPFPAKTLDEMKINVKEGYYDLGTTLTKELKSLIIEVLQFDANLRPSLKKISEHSWMEKMKKEIKQQIGKMKTEFKVEQGRAKVQKDKPSKKHKRYDSIMNQYCNESKKCFFNQITGQSTAITHQKQERESQNTKNKAKKKCKTQGEESIEKFIEGSKQVNIDYKSKIRKEKENMNTLKMNFGEVSKTSNLLKSSESMLASLKMKRIADKIGQLTSKYPLQKKKNRLKTHINE